VPRALYAIFNGVSVIVNRLPIDFEHMKFNYAVDGDEEFKFLDHQIELLPRNGFDIRQRELDVDRPYQSPMAGLCSEKQ
jgi:hypothetical protein